MRVVQIRPLQHDSETLLGNRLGIGRGIGLEQAEIVGPAAAEAVALVVNRHGHQSAFCEPRGVLLDADRQGIHAVADDHSGALVGRPESLRKKELAVERRAAVHIERDLPCGHALGQVVVPVARLGPAFALHVAVGGLAMKGVAVTIDDLGANLRRGPDRRKRSERTD